MNIFDLLVVQPIFNLLIGLYSIIPGGDFGISLIIFTVLVRFALYPLVKKQLHQTQAMKKLQPELARIKKHGVNPFRSIGILLIQLPIFIALYSVIQIFTQHREQIEKFTYGFLEGVAPIKQIIEQPNQFNEMFLGIVDLTKAAITTNGVDWILIGLAIIAAVTQYVMSKQTMPHSEPKKGLRQIMAEAAEGKEADQAEMNAVVMNKMIKVLPFMMFFIMISVPGALALYYAVSNLVAMAQQAYLLKQDEDELEELADEAPKTHKKATAKAREKAAQSATITRIKASEPSKASKKEAK